MGREHADRPAGLDQQRLVAPEVGEAAFDGQQRPGVARGLAGAAVDDQLLGVLGHLGVEVVVQHPQRRLLRPPAGGQGWCRGRHGGGAGRGGGGGRAWSQAISSVEAVSERPVTDSAAATSDRSRTSAVAAAISGARWRSGPGPATCSRSARDDGRGGRARRHGCAQVERPRGGQHLDGQDLGQPVDGAAELAGRRPPHRDVVLLHRRRRDGVDRRRVRQPLEVGHDAPRPCTGRSSARSRRPGRRPGTAAGRSTASRRGARSVRRSEIDARSATTMARKSRTYADRGAVEVAVRLDPAVDGDDGVVDDAGQLAGGHERGVVEGVAHRAGDLRRAPQRVGVLDPGAAGLRAAVARDDR